MSQEKPVDATIELGTATAAGTGAFTFTNNQAEGEQKLSLPEARHLLKASSEAHKQAIELAAHQHSLQETTKDNDQRRKAFNIVLAVLIGVLIVALLLATKASNGTTRAWEQGIVSSVMGGILGGVLGYFTGKSSK